MQSRCMGADSMRPTNPSDRARIALTQMVGMRLFLRALLGAEVELD